MQEQKKNKKNNKNENINTRETYLSQTRRNNGIQNEPYFPRPLQPKPSRDPHCQGLLLKAVMYHSILVYFNNFLYYLM